ncbi:MAG TPA: PilZ domain-containing protein [Myxococcaceae bacterium]|nr:PilZ domain-containing protein [Myxococcaceae bacterium]
MSQSGSTSPSASTSAERRRAQRIPARVEVRFDEVGQAAKALKAFTTNVSSGGVCLRTQANYPLGHRLALQLRVADDQLDLTAAVCWVRPDAVGLRFVDVSEEHRRMLDAVLATIQSP